MKDETLAIFTITNPLFWIYTLVRYILKPFVWLFKTYVLMAFWSKEELLQTKRIVNGFNKRNPNRKSTLADKMWYRSLECKVNRLK